MTETSVNETGGPSGCCFSWSHMHGLNDEWCIARGRLKTIATTASGPPSFLNNSDLCQDSRKEAFSKQYITHASIHLCERYDNRILLSKHHRLIDRSSKYQNIEAQQWSTPWYSCSLSYPKQETSGAEPLYRRWFARKLKDVMLCNHQHYIQSYTHGPQYSSLDISIHINEGSKASCFVTGEALCLRRRCIRCTVNESSVFFCSSDHKSFEAFFSTSNSSDDNST